MAEEHYRRSFEANPCYFWLLADFSLFYAESDRPVADRRRLLAPLLAGLRENFGDEAVLPALLSRIELKLAAPRAGHGASEEPSK